MVVIADAYLPGWKAGGPIRSISAIVDRLHPDFEFLIFTRDRDIGDAAPYSGIELDSWVQSGDAQIYYASPPQQQGLSLWRAVDSADPDLVFLNSVFSRLSIRFLTWRRVTRSRTPTLIAARGELSPGAYRLKGVRKRAFMTAARAFALFKGVRWQASTESEKLHIRSIVGDSAHIAIASNLPLAPGSAPPAARSKEPGSALLTFIANVFPMKNLPFLIDVLREVRGEVVLSVFGPKDERHWMEVTRRSESLPSNIALVDGGVLDYPGVLQKLADCHYYVLPTYGENFGHGIFEALANGRPVIISDRTPWSTVDAHGAGNAIPLEDRASWVAAIQSAVDCDGETYRTLASNAFTFAKGWYSANDALVGTQRSVLMRALGQGDVS